MKRSSFLGLLGSLAVGTLRSQDAGYEESLRLVRVLQARDDSTILPLGRTTLYEHGAPAQTAVVLFHGFTNCPQQYDLFAQRLHASGCNVLIPRLPEHGDRNRMTTRLEHMTAAQLISTANDAVAAARGLGRRLVVSGLSLGGVLAAWLATQRDDIDLCVCLAPAFGIDHLWYPLNVYASVAMRAMPASTYVWWDPRLKERITPSHAYPRYPLRALGECYLIGEWTIGAQAPFPGAGRVRTVFALNPKDPAVNNAVTVELSQRWRQSGVIASSEVWLEGFPAMHDVIEPENPHECIERCYPPLLDLILR